MIGSRRAPAHILAALREIDPRADLIHLHGRFWLLGVYNPNGHQRRAAERELGRTLEHPVRTPERQIRIEVLTLCRDKGFRPIQLYECREPDWHIVHDFRERDWNFRHRAEQTFRERAAESDTEHGLERRKAIMREFIEAEGRSIWRTAFKHPVQSTLALASSAVRAAFDRIFPQRRRNPA